MKWLLSILLVICMSGCISSAVQDAIDAADESVRLKWAEEWKPALKKEIGASFDEAKDSIILQTVDKIDRLEDYTDSRFATLNVTPADYDVNQDGKLQAAEAVSLLKELKAKNDEQGQPFEWYELLLMVICGYVPATGAKELLKSKLSKPKEDPVS